VKNFRDLLVWEKAHAFNLRAYQITASFPREEMYGLVSQLRRAASSVPTNIAEGCGRGTDRDMARFLQIAMGSASETEYLLLLSNDLHYLDSAIYPTVNDAVQEVKRMLASLLRKLTAES